MKYIYTSKDCLKCVLLKAEYVKNNIPFEERDAERIKNHQDEIDREALVVASMQNMELPVEVEYPISDSTRYGLS